MAARLQYRQQIQRTGGQQGERGRVDNQGLFARKLVAQGLHIRQQAANQAADGGAQACGSAQRGHVYTQPQQGTGSGAGGGANTVFFPQFGIKRVLLEGFERPIGLAHGLLVKAVVLQQILLQLPLQLAHGILHFN